MSQTYRHLRHAFRKLPALPKLSLYFDTTIDDETYPLRKLLDCMLDRTDQLKTLLRPLLEPDTGNIMGMYEHAHAGSAHLEEAYRIYKELCHVERTINVAQLSTRAADHVDTIVYCYEQWPRLQHSVRIILAHIRDNWTIDTPDKHDGPEYLG